MNKDGIVLGLLDTSRAIDDPVAAERFRSLTIAWSRYGYHDLIIERDTVDGILSAATDCGFRYCFILAYGCIVHERWLAEDGPHRRDFFSLLRAWIENHDFCVTGTVEVQQPDCLLVDLENYQPGREVQSLSEELRRHILNLRATDTAHRSAITPYFGEGIARYDADIQQDALSPDQHVFMATVKNQTANARRGVFLWNIESYDDIETPRSDFQPPISTLYSVAAGFKPNRILHTHGFSEDSRVVYFDYSPHALEIRQTIVDQWDGNDFPRFVKYLFKKFPHPDTFYQLWDNLTPDEVASADIEAMWQRELGRWGGPQSLKEHWRAYQQLEHDYVCCDLLADSSALMSKIADEPSAIIWWSNAFFTMYGNWLFSIEQRRKIYDRWIEQLATRNPNLYLFGSDFNNTNVNFIQAAEYYEEYRRDSEDYLNPRKLYQTEIRM